jgi:D-alanyl-D-alanine carboxypeptidase
MAIRLALAPASALVVAALLAACTGGAGGAVRGSGPPPTTTKVAVAPYATFPASVARALPRPTQQKLQAVLDEALVLHDASPAAGARGLAAAVISDHGSWAGAAGTDGVGARVQVRSMMPIDSITKTFTAAEVLLLSQAGKVDLDAPLSRYIDHPLTAGGATVRQVLSMRSGVSDPREGVYDRLAHLPEAAKASWSIEKTLAYLRPNLSARGPVPQYSSVNYLLLGMLVEKLTGRPMAQVLRADLFTPAHLTRVAAQDTERPVPPAVAAPRSLVTKSDGYLPSRAWTHFTHDTFAGIAADAQTVALWGYQLYGARLLAPASVRAMTTAPTPDQLFPGLGYALGTMVFSDLATDPGYGHEGSGPASSSILVVVPVRHLSLAILMPEENRHPEEQARELLHAFAAK